MRRRCRREGQDGNAGFSIELAILRARTSFHTVCKVRGHSNTCAVVRAACRTRAKSASEVTNTSNNRGNDDTRGMTKDGRCGGTGLEDVEPAV